MKEGKSVYYIELHYNYARYNIYNVMVKNYEEFWEWLVSGDRGEFILISSTQREIKYIRDKISNFYEKQSGIETARSKAKEKNKNILLLTSFSSLKSQEELPMAKIKNEIPESKEEQKPDGKTVRITSLEAEHVNKYAARLEKENIVLKSKIAELESRISLKEIHEEVSNEIYQELQQKVDYEKSLNEKQNIELDLYKQKVILLEKTIAASAKEIETQRKINKEAEQELMSAKSKCESCKAKELQDEFINVSKSIENFSEENEHHLNVINELQEKLAMEQLRASKAKKDMDSFIESVITLKEKLK